MFSWSKKTDPRKKTKARRESGDSALNEFGIPACQGPKDEDLEAELRALTGGVFSQEDDLELNDEGSDVEAEFMKLIGETKAKKKLKKTEKTNSLKERDGGNINLDKDLLSMNEDDIGDEEDGDIDENDPELLGELLGLTEADEEDEAEDVDDEDDNASEKNEELDKKEVTVSSLLMERLKMYKEAENKAKENRESSRARRFARGIKTLQQLIKKAEAGEPVLPSDIPPVIATNLKPAPPFPPPAATPTSNLSEQGVEETKTSLDKAKLSDVIPIKNMEALNIDEEHHDTGITESEYGTRESSSVEMQDQEPGDSLPIKEPVMEVDNLWLTMLRSRRDDYKVSALKAKRNDDLETALLHVKYVKQLNSLIAAVEHGERINESDIPPPYNQTSPTVEFVENVKPLKFEASSDDENYEIPTTVLQALNQRLKIYKGYQKKAEQLEDEAGARKNFKIAQLYMEAIKLHRIGKRVPLHKLPNPPGCPPIPIPFEVD